MRRQEAAQGSAAMQKVDKNYGKLQYAALELMGAFPISMEATVVTAWRPGVFVSSSSPSMRRLSCDTRRLSNQ
jgi:hypothetical protein